LQQLQVEVFSPAAVRHRRHLQSATAGIGKMFDYDWLDTEQGRQEFYRMVVTLLGGS
jgi:hypothetical protein